MKSTVLVKINSILFSLLIGLSLFFSHLNLHAEEHGAPPAEGHEAPAGGGEGGEGEGGANKDEKGAGFIKKDEYLELNAAIEQIGAKMKAKRESIKKLLQDKETINEPKQFRETVKQIEKEYKELKDLNDNIEKKRAIIRFRFPDRGFVKQNKKIKVDSLEDIEIEAGIDKELDGAIDKMRMQYGHILNPPKKNKDANEGVNENPNSLTTTLPKKGESSKAAHERLPASKSIEPTHVQNQKTNNKGTKTESLIQEIPTPENDPTGTVILSK